MKETGWRANQLRIDNTSFLGHTFRTYPGSIALYALSRKKTRQKSDNLTKTRREKLCIWSAVSGPQTKTSRCQLAAACRLKFKQCRPEWVHSDGGETLTSTPGCYAAFFWVFFLVACRKMASIATAKMTPKGYATAVL